MALVTTSNTLSAVAKALSLIQPGEIIVNFQWPFAESN